MQRASEYAARQSICLLSASGHAENAGIPACALDDFTDGGIFSAKAGKFNYEVENAAEYRLTRAKRRYTTKVQSVLTRRTTKGISEDFLVRVVVQILMILHIPLTSMVRAMLMRTR